jgi:chemotaxis protein methyltransferase CheR
MKIIVSKNINFTNVVVDNLDTKESIEEFFEATKEAKRYAISFFNIKVLPFEVLIRLNNLKELVNIEVNETVLKYYLQNLGFKAKLIQPSFEKKKKLFDKIVIGGSAGSLEKLIQIVKALPKSSISIFVIIHEKGDKKSHLKSILQKYTTNYNVEEAVSDTKVRHSTIYTIPADKHLHVLGDYIFLTDEDKKNFARPSISVSFKSLADEYASRLLAILLCGYGHDGSDVLKYLIKRNTSVLIENPDECKAQDMLTNAIKTKHFDYIMKIDEINDYILKYTKMYKINYDNLDIFLKNVYEKYGFDYRNYQREHIKRRVERFYIKYGFKDFSSMEKEVLNSESIFNDMFLDISINVTTFFRNPEMFKELRDEVMLKLESFTDIKVWCTGCSTGEEPYSIAIILKELGLLDKSLIYATDINQTVLQEAKNGLYSKNNFEIFKSHYKQSGGRESFSDYFDDYGDFVAVNDEIKEKVLFFQHNLVTDGILNEFQLILCRNVLIYFDSLLKNRTLELFLNSTSNYSFLVLGESENIRSSNWIECFDKKNNIYKKNGVIK